MSGHVGTVEKTEVMDNFSQVMANSGHNIDVIRRSLVNGMKGHVRKVERCAKNGQEFHRSANNSAKSRKSKKIDKKTKLVQE